MSARIISGTQIGAEIREEIAQKVRDLKEMGVTPGLSVVLVGGDPASVSYAAGKAKAAQELGIHEETFILPQDTTEAKLLVLIAKLNADPRFHGILVQLPLPPHISGEKVTYAISPSKDVDAFHPVNVGRLFIGQPSFLPCTPHGIQQLLLRSGYDPGGKHVVICGRSNIVGKPLAAMLMHKGQGANATVTVCHTGTPNMAYFTRQADILVASVGSPHLIKADMVKAGAVVIDVGVNRVADAAKKSGFRLVGDVDFEAVMEKAEAITPVPGGVGPMTITMLMWNVAKAAQDQMDKKSK